MVPFDMSGMVSYYNPKVTLSIRRAVFQIFDFKNVMTLKSRSEVTQGHRTDTDRSATYDFLLTYT